MLEVGLWKGPMTVLQHCLCDFCYWQVLAFGVALTELSFLVEVTERVDILSFTCTLQARNCIATCFALVTVKL